jgi:gentisate 1,2-dioxygenase
MAATAHTRSLENVGDLDGLNRLLAPLSFRAGWNKHEPSLWPQPVASFRAAKWSWLDAKAGLRSAGRLINTDLAERRNLFMVNPLEGNYYATLRTLVSAYQMILPGERARSHRHSPNALRLVLDVPANAYTVVDGIRIDMQPGDVVLTPNWSWHGHANDGDRAGYWIDFLDVPLVHLLETMFLEQWPQGFQVPTTATRDSPFVFPWVDTKAGLAEAQQDDFGRTRIELGSPALPTIALHMERIKAGHATRPMRTTLNQIVAVVSGSGKTFVGGTTFSWSLGDVMALPCWNEFFHEATADSVLLTVSDEPVQKTLGFWRTQPAYLEGSKAL